MKAYLDTNIVSALVRDDVPSESEALSRLLEAEDDGRVQLVASNLTLEEINRVPPEYLPRLERQFYLLEKVAVVRWDELVFARPVASTKPGLVGPLSVNEPMYDRLLNAGLDVNDARHLFVAAKQACQAFITFDNSRRTGILRRASRIQSLTGMAVQRPSEFLAAQGW
jgi:predicted nucleic acid-binding protein